MVYSHQALEDACSFLERELKRIEKLIKKPLEQHVLHVTHARRFQLAFEQSEAERQQNQTKDCFKT